MSHNKLIRMANDIAAFFETQPKDEGEVGVADHINRFWEPRMRRHLFEAIDAGGAGLKPLVLASASKIKRPQAA